MKRLIHQGFLSMAFSVFLLAGLAGCQQQASGTDQVYSDPHPSKGAGNETTSLDLDCGSHGQVFRFTYSVKENLSCSQGEATNTGIFVFEWTWEGKTCNGNFSKFQKENVLFEFQVVPGKDQTVNSVMVKANPNSHHRQFGVENYTTDNTNVITDIYPNGDAGDEASIGGILVVVVTDVGDDEEITAPSLKATRTTGFLGGDSGAEGFSNLGS